MVFLIVSLIAFHVAAIFMPKRITWLDIWCIALFSIVVESFSNMALDLKLNLYGYIAPGNQWSGFLPIFLYPPVNAIYLNYFPFAKTNSRKAAYILAWTAFCLVYEVAALESGFFYYLKWKLWYSALCYPVLLLLVLGSFKFTRWLQRRAG
ncbi:CBO0543 family protein [Cohnella candidum]